MSILIGADIVPTKSNYDLFAKGGALELVGQDLMYILNKADFRIFNLEVPLTDTEKPIAKYGPNLIAPCSTAVGLKALGVNLVTLANNHILDQDVQGLVSTMGVLDEAGIAYLGVGNTPMEAAKPYIFESAGKKIGVYACAEHEFSIVSDKRPGANPYDSLESFDHVAKLKKQCDFVIVLYHGGKEHYRYPSPNLQKVFRKFADKGANLIIAQHTHCIGCMEEYNGSTLVYGQGNFLFDNSDSEYWQTSLLINLDMNKNTIEYLPIIKTKNTIRISSVVERDIILNEFEKRSKEITRVGFINEKYSQYAKENCQDYYLKFFGRLKNNILIKILNRITSYGFIKSMYHSKSRIIIENVLECESHLELASEVMSFNRKK